MNAQNIENWSKARFKLILWPNNHIINRRCQNSLKRIEKKNPEIKFRQKEKYNVESFFSKFYTENFMKETFCKEKSFILQRKIVDSTK